MVYTVIKLFHNYILMGYRGNENFNRNSIKLTFIGELGILKIIISPVKWLTRNEFVISMCTE